MKKIKDYTKEVLWLEEKFKDYKELESQWWQHQYKKVEQLQFPLNSMPFNLFIFLRMKEFYDR